MLYFIRKIIRVLKRATTVSKLIAPISELVMQNKILQAETEIAKMTLDFSRKIKDETVNPHEIVGAYLDLDEMIDLNSAGEKLRDSSR